MNGDLFGLKELSNYLGRKRKIFFLNFLAGIARGLGFAIGMTIIFAFLLLILRKFVSVPFLGRYIAQLLEIIETQRALPR
ncbi:MAG: DUF5665 domain-containing protein [candidate division WOR-3 bacterium]